MNIIETIPQVSLSLFKILLQVTRPRIALLGKLPKIAIFRNILQYPGAKRIDGILMVRVDSSIYFSNANYVKERYLYFHFFFLFLS